MITDGITALYARSFTNSKLRKRYRYIIKIARIFDSDIHASDSAAEVWTLLCSLPREEAVGSRPGPV